MIMNMVGGGVALNFKILGGTVQPENPSENTIWVNTDAKITDWVFSASEPENPTEGLLWVANGTDSKATFNALKKGTVYVYPYACKQYVSGAWVRKDAVSYIGGEWKDWGQWIIKDGLTTYTIKTAKKASAASYTAMSSLSVSQGDGSINIKGSFGDGMVYIEGVDLTNFTKLTIEGTFTQVGSDTANNLTVWKSVGSYTSSNRAAYAKLTATGATVDVSDLAGEHIVGVAMDLESSSNATWKITNFWLE